MSEQGRRTGFDLLGVVGPLVIGFVAVSALLALVGENPWTALGLIVAGSLGRPEGIGFTLFYATDFIFGGLAVAIAYRAGLFNIGVEGQALSAGFGLALIALGGASLPAWLLLPLCVLAAMIAGSAWALVPGVLQAWRGSHVVITTIMMNFIASAFSAWVLVDVLRAPGSMQAETRAFPPASELPKLDGLLRHLGLPETGSPLNITFLLALAVAFAVWAFLFRTRTGFRLRAYGANPQAAHYAGISPRRMVLIAMGLSGALSAGLAVNEVLGSQNRLILDFTSGFGFVGIPVALVGRGHPLGIVFAGLFFGMLYQGGAELAFDMPRVSRDMIVLLQGVIVLGLAARSTLHAEAGA